MEKPLNVEKPTSSQENVDSLFNNFDLIQAIKQLRDKLPTLNSHLTWEALVLHWPVELPEVAVEACLMTHFDYPEEETLLIQAIKNRKAAMAKCDCARSPRLVTEDDIEYYKKIPKDVDPKTTISVPLLRVMLDTPSTLLSFLPRNSPTELSVMPFSSMDAGQRVYALFYAEWDAWMGPPYGQIHSKARYCVGLEAKLFQNFSHCKHKMTYWNPCLGYSFEQHVQRALQSPCSNWRSNFEWLGFALSHTQDQDTIKMVNSILAGQFGLKCRHMTHRFIEWQSWHCKWFYKFRVDSKTVAFVTPNEGEPETKWAERKSEKDHRYSYLYPPLKLHVGASSPSLKSIAEMTPAERNAMMHHGIGSGGNRCTSRQWL
ncbi:hypothetical protein DSL72_002169 [Monilinia vaccinii-corymbosi]|uniref:Uncharacterized protein n=1 Tax=Monilinia vaccinii-corymbosi TaxID=61207 RepID=A0A8A3PBV1_9HELO|nr:hypothetical protein DSL72_002169 [Monilinia vaccinii-corymbosi]